MSDEEGGGKKSGYRLEYASSARAKCKGAISRFTFFFPSCSQHHSTSF